MNNIDEIKTVILLTGAKRVPHLEAEIFANEELTTLYLNNLCKEISMYHIADSNAWLAFSFAYHIIDGRWPEAEVVIKTDKDYWSDYCYFFYDTIL